jgi:hypothetical protein
MSVTVSVIAPEHQPNCLSCARARQSVHHFQRTCLATERVMVEKGVLEKLTLSSNPTVAVVMSSGTDIVRGSSDIVLIGSDLTKFVETVRIARRCHRTIIQNFVGTLVVDTIGVGLAAFWVSESPPAAFIHVSSEMIFIVNSARLLPPVSSTGKHRQRSEDMRRNDRRKF